ncbi:mitochondrial carrier protein [Fadolivirus algeromassiliense]|jgi:hypothetical protein|uniref:Mitochondrial carrier protein n=1 Tax=Fadolivirus FV1/VV64 TaxID=3070911 RepID=A0A7D3QUY0_9VIRU|nr:mitochondrial carrier protein [Fadolivirus algeromassiliense]QKF94567.1 mitochondrial carrier protein [Fadolivirus FV1/VV64]
MNKIIYAFKFYILIINTLIMSLLDLAASSVSTTIAEILTIPICTVKTNYQTNLHHTSIIDVTKNIYNTRGIFGFYNASLSAIMAQVVSTSSKFTSYTYLKKLRNTQKHDIKNNIINGAIGGTIASIFSHPFDVIKVHQQNNIKFVHELKTVGPSLFYRGYSKSLSKNILLTSLLFPFYDFYSSKVNNVFLASALSSLTVTTIIQPVDYLKVRHISDQPLYMNFNNLYSALRYYYRGLHINLMRVIPHFMITMFITEEIKKHYK